MKKVSAIALAILCASALVTQAGDAPKKSSPEKSSTKSYSTTKTDGMAALLAKYDANKDGKLDASEKAAMSKEDKDKLAKLPPVAHHKKKKEAATAAVPATPAVPAAPAVPAVPAAASTVSATPAAPTAAPTK